MSTKNPQKPRNKPTPSAVISREELDAAEAEDIVGGPNLANVEIYRDQALKLLLHPDGQASMRWKEFAATNPDNVQLGNYLKRLWTPAISRDTPPCAASAGMGTALVWFGQSHHKGSPSLSGYELCEAVRRVLQMPDPEDGPAQEPRTFDEIKAEGKSRPKNHIGTPKPIAKRPTLAEVVQTRVEIALKLIDDSPWQTRSEPPAAMTAELAHSIKIVGLLKPLRVREMPGGRYQQIGGHRRRRAVAQLGWHKAPCDVVRCDDVTAALEVREDNKQEPLNAIEKARGLQVIWQSYESAGRTQRQMAEDLGIDQGTISNQIRLLEAPGPLQKRLISGDISQGYVRQLVPWAENPKLVERFQKELDNRCRSGPVSKNHWESALQIAINSISKSVTKHSGYTLAGDPLFDCSKHADKLDIREVTINGRKERRAFNVKEWNSLQAEAKSKKDAREKKKAAAAPEKSKAKAALKRTDIERWPVRQHFEEAWNEMAWTKLIKFLQGKITKPQKMVAVRLVLFCEDTPDCDLSKLLSLSPDQWLDEQFEILTKQMETNCPYRIDWAALSQIAEHFGIDIRSDWKPTRQLLDSCELIDLQDIAAEMPVEDLKPSDAKNLLVNQLLQHWPAGWVPELLNPDPKPKKAKK